MFKSILGEKVGMTQIFDTSGRVVPVTIVQAGPCVVTQVKTQTTDGYDAVQIGFQETHGHRLSRPERGHLGLLGKKKGDDSDAPARKALPAMKTLREVRLKTPADETVGQEIRVDRFAEGEIVAVTGITKGKGFAGGIKRHHFSGAPMTHGAMEVHRKPASSGATDAARTFKGVKKPGHLGDDRVTVRGLTVVKVDAERNLLLIKGPVPGANGGLVYVRSLKG